MKPARKRIEQPTGISVEFINAPKEGAKFKSLGRVMDALIETAKLNKATRILIVFDRE